MERFSTKKVLCREVWGGNERVDEDIKFGRLRGHFLSLPYESGKGGDILFLSFCEREGISKIVIADVAGHGEIVSKIATELRNLLRDNVDEVDNSRLLALVNHSLQHKLHEGKFVTMVAATLNGATGDLVYAYAGHPTAFKFNSTSEKWEFMQHVEHGSSGLPLGIVGDTEYVQMKAGLKQGDMLLFYTDGLLDIKRNSQERITINELLEICQRVTTENVTPREMASSLVKHIEESSDGGFRDDVTVLVAEVT